MDCEPGLQLFSRAQKISLPISGFSLTKKLPPSESTGYQQSYPHFSNCVRNPWFPIDFASGYLSMPTQGKKEDLCWESSH